ncbi:MAG TPA: hypothetical protein VFA07_19550 [Chthonomonadaceae bacterium]|nr:hypothetical protein [Chthonomonadaceae bacterium]
MITGILIGIGLGAVAFVVVRLFARDSAWPSERQESLLSAQGGLLRPSVAPCADIYETPPPVRPIEPARERHHAVR